MKKESLKAKREGRLDLLLSELFGCSRAQAAHAIRQGRVWVNGCATAKASRQIVPGEELTLETPDAVEMEAQKENIAIEILYQDEDIAVVVKPHGMVVHPAAGHESGTLVNALLFAIEDLSGIGGVKRPGIVHRLDKDTSGLLLIAKNDAAHMALASQLRERRMEKHYVAVTEGCMKESTGSVDAAIARSKRDRKKMAVDPAGREALTDWRLLENMKGCALLDVRIHTGRTHQIRVHMRHIHHPVAGDPIYGFQGGIRAPRLMLHAYSLAFIHPRTGEALRFVAPPPDAFVKALEKWREQADKPLPW